jgi:hypothetical protein
MATGVLAARMTGIGPNATTTLAGAIAALLGEVSRARITQIMSLRYLAPAIQERILALPAVWSAAEEGVNERQLRGVAQRCDWRKQLRMWEELEGGKRKSARGGEKGGPC